MRATFTAKTLSAFTTKILIRTWFNSKLKSLNRFRMILRLNKSLSPCGGEVTGHLVVTPRFVLGPLYRIIADVTSFLV